MTCSQVLHGHSALDLVSAATGRARYAGGSAASLLHTASLDQLTGAYLRGPGLLQFQRDLGRADRNAEPLVVAFSDVDHLKTVNDGAGHSAGDRLLRHVAQTLQDQLRPHDLIIRYGGDEFMTVIVGLELEEVSRRFAGINKLLLTGPVPGTVTTGLAQHQAGDAMHDLINRADTALYRSRSGRPPSPA